MRVNDVESPSLHQLHEPPYRQQIEPAAGLQQVDRNPRLAEDWHKLALTTQDGDFLFEATPVGVRQQRQQVIFRAAAVQRGDDLEHTRSADRDDGVGRLGEHRLHGAVF
jgi:hypothetical protein